MAELSAEITGQVALSSTAASQLGTTGQYSNSIGGVTVKAMAVNGATNVYVGGSSSVSATTGYELAAGVEHTFDVMNLDELWVISGGGTTAKVCFTL